MPIGAGESVATELLVSKLEGADVDPALAGLTRDDREAIARTAGVMMSLYRSGTADEFESWREEIGLPRLAWQENAEWSWSALFPVRDAPLDLERARLILRADDGEAISMPDDRQGTGSTTSRLKVADEMTGAIDPELYRGKVVEVLVPFRYDHPDNAQQAEAFLGIGLGRRDDGVWVPMFATYYGVPLGWPMPPLPI
jgi:hypothetical protein